MDFEQGRILLTGTAGHRRLGRQHHCFPEGGPAIDLNDIQQAGREIAAALSRL